MIASRMLLVLAYEPTKCSVFDDEPENGMVCGEVESGSGCVRGRSGGGEVKPDLRGRKDAKFYNNLE